MPGSVAFGGEDLKVPSSPSDIEMILPDSIPGSVPPSPKGKEPANWQVGPGSQGRVEQSGPDAMFTNAGGFGPRSASVGQVEADADMAWRFQQSFYSPDRSEAGLDDGESDLSGGVGGFSPAGASKTAEPVDESFIDPFLLEMDRAADVRQRLAGGGQDRGVSVGESSTAMPRTPNVTDAIPEERRDSFKENMREVLEYGKVNRLEFGMIRSGKINPYRKKLDEVIDDFLEKNPEVFRDSVIAAALSSLDPKSENYILAVRNAKPVTPEGMKDIPMQRRGSFEEAMRVYMERSIVLRSAPDPNFKKLKPTLSRVIASFIGSTNQPEVDEPTAYNAAVKLSSSDNIGYFVPDFKEKRRAARERTVDNRRDATVSQQEKAGVQSSPGLAEDTVRPGTPDAMRVIPEERRDDFEQGMKELHAYRRRNKIGPGKFDDKENPVAKKLDKFLDAFVDQKGEVAIDKNAAYSAARWLLNSSSEGYVASKNYTGSERPKGMEEIPEARRLSFDQAMAKAIAFSIKGQTNLDMDGNKKFGDSYRKYLKDFIRSETKPVVDEVTADSAARSVLTLKNRGYFLPNFKNIVRSMGQKRKAALDKKLASYELTEFIETDEAGIQAPSGSVGNLTTPEVPDVLKRISEEQRRSLRQAMRDVTAYSIRAKSSMKKLDEKESPFAKKFDRVFREWVEKQPEGVDEEAARAAARWLVNPRN